MPKISIDFGRSFSLFTLELGAIIVLNPRDFDSLIRVSNPLTERTSPPNPTSPIKTTESEISLSWALDATADITDKSAAGSFTFKPPTKLTNTSFVPI